MSPSPFERYRGQNVVVDTRSPHITFLGRLEEIAEGGLLLRDADVHDADQSRTPREVYVMETHKHGVKVNRKEVLVRLEEVVSVSRLEDVVVY